MKDEDLKVSMLTQLMSRLPQGFSTKCTTAQLKSVQHNCFDTPKKYWCCWTTNSGGEKFFAMYDGHEVKLISENTRKNYSVKPIKS